MRKKLSNKNSIIIPLGLLALSIFAFFWLMVAGPELAPGEIEGKDGASSRQPGIYYGPPESIAVLPFDTVALDPEWAFLGSAVPAVLLRQLSALEEPQVSAIASALFFQEERPPHGIIGQRLQAQRLLEGRFSEENGDLRLDVSLIRSRDGKVLESAGWSQPATRLSELQRQLAEFLAGTVNITANLLLPLPIPSEPVAWEAFLRGLHGRLQHTEEGNRAAESHFLEALDADPDFAAARAELAANRLASPNSGSMISLVQAREWLEQYVASHPRDGRVLAWLAWARHRYDGDWAGAEEASRQALELLPGDAEVMNIASLSLFTRGEFVEAEALLSRSVARDPLNLATRLRQGLALEFQAEWDRALSVYRTLSVLNPDVPGVYAFRARARLLQGEPDSALTESEKETDPFWRRYARTLVLFSLERQGEAAELLDLLIEEDGGHAAYQVAEIQAHRGEIDLAFEWLETARRQGDRGLSELVGNPFFSNLTTDPRWAELLTALGHRLD